MKWRVLIADDEDLGRERLRHFLIQEPQVEIVAECKTGLEALQTIRQTGPHIVFLDVKMPELDGFAVLRALQGASVPVVIFVTAHDHFALRAFEVAAVDYLLKPFDRVRLQTALSRAVARLQSLEATAPLLERSESVSLDRLAVRSQGRISFVGIRDIDWICSADNYVAVHVAKTTHLLRGTLRDLEGQLPAQFIRISRSHLVNLERIKEIRCKSHGDGLVVLQDGTLLPASRRYRRKLRPLWGNGA